MWVLTEENRKNLKVPAGRVFSRKHKELPEKQAADYISKNKITVILTVGDVATSGEKELKRNYPVEEGTTAGTTKQEGRQMNLTAEEGSLVPRRKKAGME